MRLHQPRRLLEDGEPRLVAIALSLPSICNLRILEDRSPSTNLSNKAQSIGSFAIIVPKLVGSSRLLKPSYTILT